MRKILIFPLLFSLMFFWPPFSAAGAEPIQPEVRVAFFQYMSPFQFVDEFGNPSGMHIDMVDLIAEQENFSVTYIPYITKSQCMEALDQGIVDAVLGYQIQSHNNTRHRVTSELSRASVSIVAQRDLVQYMTRTGNTDYYSVAFEFGTIDYSLLYTLGLHRFMGMGNQEQAVDALLGYRADILVGASESLNYLLQKKDAWDDFQVVYNQVSSISYTVLVRADNHRLQMLLDRKLLEMHTNGSYEKIYNKWAPNRIQEKLQNRLQNIALASGAAVALILLVAGMIARVNRILKNKIDEKTKMISQANQLLHKHVNQLQNEIDFRNRMIDSVPSGIIFFDTDFYVTVMNPAARVLCGGEPSLCDDVQAWDIPVFGTLLQHMKEDVFSPRLHLEQPCIIVVDIGASVQKYRCWLHRLAEEDHFTGALMMVENVTREEQRREELFEAEKSKTLNRIVAGIAHEIKNPLMNVQTAASLILTQWENPKVREAFTQFIPDEVDRMNRLVESLLNYAKPTSEEVSVFQLSDVINRCLYLAQITEKKKQIHFSVSLDDALFVRAQKDLLRQALINLLINSIWAVEQKQKMLPNLNPQETAISVRVYGEGEWVCLSVHDQGIGMPSEVINRCTDPFYTTKAAGTGLGLAMVKQFVDDNEGSLSISSKEDVYTEIQINLRRYANEA